MADERNRDRDADVPFRESGSGDDYNPQGNWGAERRRDEPSGTGGFGPEGDFAGAAGDENADVAGQVNADPDALIDEAKKLGKPGGSAQ